MARRRGPRTGECAYCGAFGVVTRDHVPPLNLFPEPRPANLNLITVPACKACNDGFKLDDEYFRLAVTAGIDGDAHPRELAWSIRAIEKLATPEKLGLARWLGQARRMIAVRSPAGLYLGHAAGIEVDPRRILRVVERIVRGLFFHHRGRRVPVDCELIAMRLGDRIHPYEPEPEMVPIVTALVREPEHHLGGIVFTYSYAAVQGNENATTWLLSFYQHQLFMVMTVPVGDAVSEEG